MRAETLDSILKEWRDAGDPETAMDLAREHYLFCPDRTSVLEPLAAELMVSSAWHFWWD